MRARLLIALSAILLVGGCATLVGGGSSQPMSVASQPGAASFTIKSSTGLQVAQGSTPSSVRLSRKNDYQIDVSLPGYRTQTMALTRGTNGWIWGNLLFGWIVGFAIDFMTGSAYVIQPSQVQVTLVAGINENGETVPIALVRLLDEKDAVLSEHRLPMVRER